MGKTLTNILLAIALAFGGFFVYDSYMSACNRPIPYAIGSVDERFGVAPDRLAAMAQETEAVWEVPFDRQFFRFDPSAKLKINLVFDERQQRTIEERENRHQISTQEEIYRAQVSDYELRLSQHQSANQSYESALAAYEQRLRAYNQQVEHWNQNGGAPAQEYGQLQQEKRSLQSEAARLERQRQELNQAVTELNAMAAAINDAARRLNLDVDAYNGKFGTSREFDQGTFTGNSINIYQFNGEQDLRLVLAHEFGHALGIDHVDEPEAIMYYLMDKQNLKNLRLSQADIQAVGSVCKIR